MAGSKSAPWIAGTVIISLLLIAASWFLLISPVTTATAEANEQTESQAQQNEMLQNQVVQLKAQSLKLDEYKAELAGLQLRVPPVTAVADFNRQLSALAATHSVTIISVAVSPSETVVPLVPVAAATDPAATDPATTTDASAPAEGTVAEDGTVTPAAPAGVQGFYQMPISLDVVGSYTNVEAFLNDLQLGDGRLFVVSALTATGQSDSEGSGGRPTTSPGDVEMLIAGSVLVLQDTNAAPPAPVDPAAAPPALPVPPGDKNPLVPIS
ncbi:hypothetical protein [Cellulomonas sp. URHE0023]|uniref:hypothetical protein n=1 Tax=Cellulomonas sp. URHE0023 TaxID=1380354 RepID=UPI0004833FBD|nr:hypothetical protein [Cellulomonas sp. URHE0023]